jgi:hypothetical protein
MSINRPVSYVKHCHDDIVGKNVAMKGTMRRDIMVNIFYLVEVTLRSWRIFFGLCKLLFLTQ